MRETSVVSMHQAVPPSPMPMIPTETARPAHPLAPLASPTPAALPACQAITFSGEFAAPTVLQATLKTVTAVVAPAMLPARPACWPVVLVQAVHSAITSIPTTIPVCRSALLVSLPTTACKSARTARCLVSSATRPSASSARPLTPRLITTLTSYACLTVPMATSPITILSTPPAQPATNLVRAV
jgi:hypothetical protein